MSDQSTYIKAMWGGSHHVETMDVTVSSYSGTKGDTTTLANNTFSADELEKIKYAFLFGIPARGATVGDFTINFPCAYFQQPNSPAGGLNVYNFLAVSNYSGTVKIYCLIPNS